MIVEHLLVAAARPCASVTFSIVLFVLSFRFDVQFPDHNTFHHFIFSKVMHIENSDKLNPLPTATFCYCYFYEGNFSAQFHKTTTCNFTITSKLTYEYVFNLSSMLMYLICCCCLCMLFNDANNRWCSFEQLIHCIDSIVMKDHIVCIVWCGEFDSKVKKTNKKLRRQVKSVDKNTEWI